jgi:hypothetical protein
MVLLFFVVLSYILSDNEESYWVCYFVMHAQENFSIYLE